MWETRYYEAGRRSTTRELSVVVTPNASTIEAVAEMLNLPTT